MYFLGLFGGHFQPLDAGPGDVCHGRCCCSGRDCRFRDDGAVVAGGGSRQSHLRTYGSLACTG